MNIAVRIQNLRKAKGISQEGLADELGVSRQAVSKWESEQSMPDIDKIILMSDYFDVTTDYLLKGTEVKEEKDKKEKEDARIFAAVGTAFDFVGLAVAIMIWIEEQSSAAVAAGLILMAFGCMIFTVGQCVGENKNVAKKWFGLINIWFLLLMPVSCIFNFFNGIIGSSGSFGNLRWILSPVPRLGNSLILFGISWLIYFGICMIADIVILKISSHG